MRKIFSFLMVALFSVAMMANSYWYRGVDNSWGATAMTVSTGGTYEYIQSSNNANQFKIAASADGWDYNYSYVQAGFNGTNVTNIGDYSKDNCYCWQSGTYYILVFVPNTEINTTNKPIICAATTLPEEEVVPETPPTYTVAGSSTELFGTAWAPENTDNDMELVGNVYTWSKTNVTLPATDVTFKVCQDHGWAKSWPASNYELQIAKSGQYDVTITFDAELEKVAATATLKKEEIVLPVVSFASGQYNNWSTTADVLVNAKDSLSASKTIHIDSIGDYEFKMVKDGLWVSLNGEGDTKYTFHRGHTAVANITTEEKRNFVLRVDNVGDYVIQWVYANDSLHITYPAAPDTTTLYFVNTYKEWTGDVYAHTYVNATAYAEWPGTKMTDTKKTVQGKNIFSVRIPDTFSTIIFNNGNSGDGNQTEPEEWTKAKPFYCNGIWYADTTSIPVIEPTKYYITGSANLVGEENAWDSTAIAVKANSYTFENLAAGIYKLKVLVDGTWAEASRRGYSNLTGSKTNLSTDGDNNINFRLAETGDVTVTYTGETFTITGDFVAPQVQICGGFELEDWPKTPYDMTIAQDGKTASWKKFIVAGSNNTAAYFKVIVNDSWLSDASALNRENLTTGVLTADNEVAMSVALDAIGEYTFTYTYATGKLSVAYPTEAAETVTLYFVNKPEWETVKAFVFEGGIAAKVAKVEWPGEAMTKTAQKIGGLDIYSYTFATAYPKIIFGNGGSGDGNQTADLAWTAAKPYYYDGVWYESAAAIDLDAEAKFYITGNAALVGEGAKWSETAIKSVNSSYVLNLPAGLYEMKITVPGAEKLDWKGYEDLTAKPAGLYTDAIGNIIFRLTEAGNVTVTYTDKAFTVSADFHVNVLENGYYLIGQKGWNIEALSAEVMFAPAETEGEYKLDVKLTADDQLKVVAVAYDIITTWYPETGDSFTVTDAYAGNKTIYFRPAGNEAWEAFGGYIWMEKNTPTDIDAVDGEGKAQKMILNGQVVILKNGKMYNILGAVIR